MTDPTQITAPSQPPRGRDPQYREIYSNGSQVLLGPFDIAVVFQKTTEMAPTQMVLIDQVTVTFSPQHFKALVRSLQAAITAYEASFGALTISDADSAPSRSAEQIIAMVKSARESGHLPILSSTEPPQPERRSRAASRKTKPQP
jgi:hypothetical protein